MTSPLWTWADLIAASAASADGTPAIAINGFSIDTRTLKPGDVFVALKDQRDGHEFVAAAFAAGAAAAIVEDGYARKAGDGALIRCANTLRALERVGVAARRRLSQDARVVAVTGSAGKTGTKEILRACLARIGDVHASEKSYNNHWGVPLTLARMPASTQFGVFEIGMNHAGEIRPLTRMVAPHAAIVTTVEAVHLEHFGSVEEIADAKAEIFEGLVPGGTAIVKAGSPHTARLTAHATQFGARVTTFGLSRGATVYADAVELNDDGTAMTIHAGGRDIPVRVAIPGRHIAENVLAVAAALAAIGADLGPALAALAVLAPPEGRGARYELSRGGGALLLIDESYNANPASMRAALQTLAAVPRSRFSRRVAVLGDMLELGKETEALHLGLKDAVDDAGVDMLFACGRHMKALFEALPEARRGGYAVKAADLQPILAAALRPGDVVMVKASNGTRLGPLIAALKAEFGKAAPLG